MTEKIPKQNPPLADSSRYKTRDVLGAGGMKVVVRAEDLQAGRDVAMAISKVSSKRNYRRFLEEARITASLEHPNIIPVHEVGHTPAGTPFFTMKIIHGDTLEQIIGKLNEGDPDFRKRYTLQALLDIFCKICDAIAFAHSKGIIHLDLKPSNILVGDYGEVLVLDWGIAHRLNNSDSLEEDAPGELDSKNSDMTMDGVVKGTPEYMAPEQAAGLNSSRTRRTDIYGLGAILYTLLTWSKPFSGDSADAIMENVMKGNLIPPHEAGSSNQKIPQALEFVIYKAMARNPEQRYPSVSLLKEDVLAYLGGYATQAEEAGFFTNALLWINRKKHAVFMFAAICLMLTVSGSLLAMHFYFQSFGRGSYKFSYEARMEAEETIAGLQNQIVSENARVWNLKFEDTFSDSYLFERWEFYRNGSSRLPRAEAERSVRFRNGEGLRIVSDSSPMRMMFLGNVKGGELRLCMDAVWHESGRNAMILAGLNTESLDQGYLFAVIPGPDSRIAVMRGDTGEILQEQRIDFPKEKNGKFDMALFQDSGKLILSMSFNGKEIIRIREPSSIVSARTVYPCILSFADSSISLLNLKLMSLGTPRRADLLDIAERLLRKGRLEGARQLYSEIIDSSSDPDRRNAALQGLRKVSLHENLRKNFPDVQKTLQKAWKNAEVKVDLESDGIAVYGKGKAFSSLAPLADLPVSSLILSNVDNVDLTPLGKRKMNRLVLRNCTLADPALLARMDVRELILRSVPIRKDLPMMRLPRAKQIVISDCKLRNVGFLRKARPELLDISCNVIADLSPLEGMMPENLDISENRVTSLKPLAGMKLKKLRAFSNRIQDASPLKNMPLEALDLSFNLIDSTEFLRGLANLQKLLLIHNAVSGIEPLSGLTRLQTLHLDYNRISSLEPLKACTEMRELSFAGNLAEDLGPLASMENLQSLDCSFNPILSADPIVKLPLEKLFAADTEIDSFPQFFASPPKKFIFIGSAMKTAEITSMRNGMRGSSAISPEVIRSLEILCAYRNGNRKELQKYAMPLRDGRKFILVPTLVSSADALKSAGRFGAELPSWDNQNGKNVLVHALDPPFWMNREHRVYGFPVKENGIFSGGSPEIKLPLVMIWK